MGDGTGFGGVGSTSELAPEKEESRESSDDVAIKDDAECNMCVGEASEPGRDGSSGSGALKPVGSAAGGTFTNSGISEDATALSSGAQSEPRAKGWDGDNYYDGTSSVFTGFVVDDHEGSTQRYWVEAGTLWRDGLKRACEGYWFYSLSTGRVLRGVYSDGNLVYLADNDGRLAGGEDGGWVVSDNYGQGLQRYYIDGNEHSAVLGYSSEGWAHYTTSEGYVFRGVRKVGDLVYLADNEGVLAGGEAGGWVVSDDYGQGLQRYYIDSNEHAAKVGYSCDGWAHYTTESGYVLRGSLTKGALVYLANNDGLLAGGASGGWVVSSAYGQGLQRYWIDPAEHAAKLGYSADGWDHYTTSAGYVLRGVWDSGAGRVFLADNDGKLPSATGWWVTSQYSGGLQRYYIDSATHAAVSGFFTVDDERYFGRASAGYVLRGATAFADHVLLADNDGKMVKAAGWLVSSLYGQGLQRYFIEELSSFKQYFGAKTGWFVVSDKDYYGKSEGYVSRSEAIKRSGSWYVTDNDGVATKFTGSKLGWQNPSWVYQVSCYTVTLPSYASGYHTYVTESRIAVDASRSDCIETFIGRAYDYLGTPYKWNYSSWPGDGVDCVGLVYQCAYACGMDMGEFNPYDHYATGSSGWHSHDANNLWNYGSVPHYGLGSRERGDVISWEGHVAIYLGDDTIIEANTGGVKISSLWAYGTPRGVMRFFN